MVDDILIVYVTCADLDQARAIARVIVQEGLAACANVRTHEAVYLWHGALTEEPEADLLLKTTRASYDALQARILSLHSYDIPCIVAWPLAAGLPAYCDWVRDNLRPA